MPHSRALHLLAFALPTTIGFVATACGSSSDSAVPSAMDAGGVELDAGTVADATPDSDRDASPSLDGSTGATGDDDDDDDGGDIVIPTDGGSPTPCPTRGNGAYTGPGTCQAFSPAQTGASGENATSATYAIAAGSNARGTLVLWLNGSGGHPSEIGDPTENVYAAAASTGDDVIALSYPSTQAIGRLCTTDEACYFATRATIILGVFQAGADSSFQDITLDEGIVDRTVLALRFLAANDAGGRWSSYLATGDAGAPGSELAWSKIVVAGHSQGGGHATAIGKLFPATRVVQFSSTCDYVSTSGPPIDWTGASNGTWSSDPSQFYGLSALTVFDGGMPVSGDLTCPYHAANWANLGMIPTHQHDDAATCANTGAHGASIGCTANYPTWVSLFE